MDKILGIISEYNPLHNGHLYHIDESKKIANPDYTVAIMSGNFVERGEPAIIDKWSRAKMALNCGIDLIIELPLIYSISSAENFASGSIKILNCFKKMDTTLSFGSECGDIDILESIANILIDKPKEYKSILNHELSLGLSFPKARENALLMYLNDIRRYANILSAPNNILGIEYLKAINEQKAKIKTITIKRNGSNYSDVNLKDGHFPSSTALRNAICSGKNIYGFLPDNVYSIIEDNINNNDYITGLSKFEQAIIYRLRTMSLEEISNIPDVTEGLENKIKKAANECNTLLDLIEKIKSKRYTKTRINRILSYTLLNITRQDMEDSIDVIPYIRVLGANEKGKELLSKLAKTNRRLNIITSPKKFLETSKNKTLINMLEKDISATNIYTLGYGNNPKSNLDYTNKLITL